MRLEPSLHKTMMMVRRNFYYLRRSFIDYEKKYTVVEKTCLALVWTTQKLRNY